MEAALILAVGLWPIMLLLGGIEVYRAMTQRQILALARVPQHLATFYDVKDEYAGGIIKSFQKSGYRLKEMKRNRRTGLFTITMKLAV